MWGADHGGDAAAAAAVVYGAPLSTNLIRHRVTHILLSPLLSFSPHPRGSPSIRRVPPPVLMAFHLHLNPLFSVIMRHPLLSLARPSFRSFIPSFPNYSRATTSTNNQVHLREFYELNSRSHEVYEWARGVDLPDGTTPHLLFRNLTPDVQVKKMRVARGGGGCAALPLVSRMPKVEREAPLPSPWLSWYEFFSLPRLRPRNCFLSTSSVFGFDNVFICTPAVLFCGWGYRWLCNSTDAEQRLSTKRSRERGPQMCVLLRTRSHPRPTKHDHKKKKKGGDDAARQGRLDGAPPYPSGAPAGHRAVQRS